MNVVIIIICFTTIAAEIAIANCVINPLSQNRDLSKA